MCTYQALEQPKTAVKKVVCPRNDHDRQVLRACPVENVCKGNRFVELAVNDQGFASDGGHRPLAGRRADQHEIFDRAIRCSQGLRGLRRDERAERETRQCQR